MKVGLDRDLLEILGRTPERPLEFPQPGGAYDTYSRLIFIRIEGNQTYKRRLEAYTDALFKELNAASPKSGIEIGPNRRDVITGLKHLIHSIAHNASIPGKHHYVSLSLNRNDYFEDEAQFAALPYSGIVTAEQLLGNCLVEGNQSYVDRKRVTGTQQPILL